MNLEAKHLIPFLGTDLECCINNCEQLYTLHGIGREVDGTVKAYFHFNHGVTVWYTLDKFKPALYPLEKLTSRMLVDLGCITLIELKSKLRTGALHKYYFDDLVRNGYDVFELLEHRLAVERVD